MTYFNRCKAVSLATVASVSFFGIYEIAHNTANAGNRSLGETTTGEKLLVTKPLPLGKKVDIRTLNPDGSETLIEGIELDFKNDDYESKQLPKFQGKQWIRILTTNDILTYRVSGTPPTNAKPDLKRNILLGANETFVSTWRPKGLKDVREKMALLLEWYKQFGKPNKVLEILIPANTEMYVGIAGEQQSGSQNIHEMQAKGTGAGTGKPKRMVQVPKEVVPGAGLQILIPRVGTREGVQLGMKDIINQYPLVDDVGY